MSARIAVLVFPGTNSEDETLRLLRDCGGNAELVHWSQASNLAQYDAYVLAGGFAYEDRIRAGAIAAHDRMMDSVIEAAGSGKLVFGICNGAQILLEACLLYTSPSTLRRLPTVPWPLSLRCLYGDEAAASRGAKAISNPWIIVRTPRRSPGDMAARSFARCSRSTGGGDFGVPCGSRSRRRKPRTA